MVMSAHGTIGHHIDPSLSYLFQQVLHDWCNKGRGVCYSVCWLVHIKDPVMLIGKSNQCSGGSGFPLSSSGPLPWVRRHITVNKMC